MGRAVETVIFGVLAAVVSLGAVACGGDDDGSTDSADADGGIGCLNDSRAEVYTANMEHPGDDGVFSFVLESSDPAPPLKGNNTWVVKVLDGSQAPVTGASFTFDLYMPEHGHRSPTIPQVTEGDDDYTFAPLYLFMPGLWQVTIQADAGDASDSTKYTFCVEG